MQLNSPAKIIVILPIYIGNNFNEFRLALRSLLRQSIGVDIMIGCDGPIKDDLTNYISVMTRKHSNIIVCSLKNNSGLANILNFCVTKCSELGYEFIGRMDGDDFSVYNRFEIQYDFLLRNPECYAVGSQLIIFNSLNRVRSFKSYRLDPDSLFNNFLYDCPLPHPGVLFRKNFFYDIKYSDKFYLNEDYHLWFQSFKINKMICNIDKPLLYFREDQAIYSRRVGLRVALSDLRIRFLFIITFGRYNLYGILYSCAIFLVKLLPVGFIKYLAKLVGKSV